LAMSENDLNMHILQNGSVLASFHHLFRQKYMGNLMIEGRNSRTPRVKTYDDTLPLYSNLTALSHLLLCQAHHKLKDGFTEEGYNSLEAVSQINMAMWQNPPLIEVVVGVNMASQLNRFILESDLSFQVEINQWIPDSSFILRGYEQALYSEYILLENMFDSEDLKASLDKEFIGWGAKFFCNKEASIAYVVQDFEFMQEALNYGILNRPVSVKRFNKINPLHWFDNPIGRIILDFGIVKPLYFSFNLKVCASIWQSDATRLVLALRNQDLQQNKENMLSVIEQFNLINPVTKQPYHVSEDGSLVLLPTTSDIWENFHPKTLEMLKGFPVVLPVSNEKQ